MPRLSRDSISTSAVCDTAVGNDPDTLGHTARIDGPACAGAANSVYASWLSTAQAYHTLPNVFSFHLEGGGVDDPVGAARGAAIERRSSAGTM